MGRLHRFTPLFAAGLVLWGTARAGEAPAASSPGGPSIEEMLWVIETKLAGHGGQGPAGLPEEAGAPSAPASAAQREGEEEDRWTKSAPAKALTAGKLSTSIEAEIRRLERRASERLLLLSRRRYEWEIAQLYMRLEKFRKAALLLKKFYATRNAGQGADSGRLNRFGEIDLEYARVMTYLGHHSLAEPALAEAKRRMELAKSDEVWDRRPGTSTVRWFDDRVAFIENYPEVREQVDALVESLAARPNGDEQWKLVELYNPRHNKAVMPLSWLVGLLEMRERYPEHEEVSGGDADWQLMSAYRHHEVYDRAAEILKGMEKKFPEFQYVKEGDHIWELAKSHEYMGRFLEEQRNGWANESYRSALSEYRRLRKEFPDHDRCQPRKDRRSGRSYQPYVTEAIAYMHSCIERTQRMPKKGRPR
jgi:hypothetical protein